MAAASRLHIAIYGADNITDHIDDDTDDLADAICAFARNRMLTIFTHTKSLMA